MSATKSENGLPTGFNVRVSGAATAARHVEHEHGADPGADHSPVVARACAVPVRVCAV